MVPTRNTDAGQAACSPFSLGLQPFTLGYLQQLCFKTRQFKQPNHPRGCGQPFDPATAQFPTSRAATSVGFAWHDGRGVMEQQVEGTDEGRVWRRLGKPPSAYRMCR